MTNEELNSLLFQLGHELFSLMPDHHGELALHSATLCADNQNSSVLTDGAIVQWIRKRIWPRDLQGSLKFMICVRFFLAFGVLSGVLQSRGKTSEDALVRFLRTSITAPPESLSGLESMFDRDRETVLRLLLIESWNKMHEKDIAKLSEAWLALAPKLAGYPEVPARPIKQERSD